MSMVIHCGSLVSRFINIDYRTGILHARLQERVSKPQVKIDLFLLIDNRINTFRTFQIEPLHHYMIIVLVIA